MIKRLLDVLAASAGLLLLAPLLVLIAVWIKLDSPGPVFFRQERVGRHGVPFRLFKFRTMRQVPVERDLQLTVGQDHRITRAGAVLRRYKIDELPQLIDVVRGTMSLVGPRPEVPRWVAEYSSEHRQRVLSVRPGITDFASLRFRDESELLARADDAEREYREVIMPEKLRVSGNYIDYASLRSDLKLLTLTLRTVILPTPSAPDSDPPRRPSALWRHLDGWMSQPHRWRLPLAVTLDGLIVLACWHATYLFRLGFERWQPGRPWYDDLVSVGVVLTYLLAMQVLGVRQALWRFFSFDDFRRLAWACAVAGPLCASAVLLAELVGVSRAVLVLHPLFTLVALSLSRMIFRMLWEHAHARSGAVGAARHYVIVLGATVLARRLIAGLHMRQGWHVLLLLDDDPNMHGLRIAGVPVVGPIDRLRDPALTLGATHVVLALGEGGGEQRQRSLELARDSGLVVMIVPDGADLEVAPPP